MRTPRQAGCNGRGNNNAPPPFKPRSAVERPSQRSRPTNEAAKQQHGTARCQTTCSPVWEGQAGPARPSQPRQQCQENAAQGVAAPKQATFSTTASPKVAPTSQNGGRSDVCQGSGVVRREADALPEDPPRPASPEKRRFFSSSGATAEMMLALNRSRKSHEQEERKRRADAARKGLAAEGESRPAAEPPTSQGTDYGDPELDAIDFDNFCLNAMGPAPKPKAADLPDDVLDEYDLDDVDVWDIEVQ